MKAFRLTKNAAGDYDLLIENGKISLIEDGGQAAQHAMQRLLIFKGEQTLDGMLTTKGELGTQWYEIIFAMDISRAEKELEIKRRITETPGILKILESTWSVADHTLSITGKVQTEWGEADISEDVTPL